MLSLIGTKNIATIRKRRHKEMKKQYFRVHWKGTLLVQSWISSILVFYFYFISWSLSSFLTLLFPHISFTNWRLYLKIIPLCLKSIRYNNVCTEWFLKGRHHPYLKNRATYRFGKKFIINSAQKRGFKIFLTT